VEPNRVRWLVGGIFLLTLAGYNFATYTVNTSFQSTFNLPSGNYQYLTRNENSGDSVSGTFQESSRNLVSYYIMTSEQYASFQSGTSFDAVYYIQDVSSGSISYGFITQDQYYFVFRHGTGLMNTAETVSYQRTYTTHDNFHLLLGIVFSLFTAVELAIAFRPRKPAAQSVPLIPLGQPAPFGTSAQLPSRSCQNCGRLVERSSIFCTSCGTKLFP
jgi:hypothetical protein